MEQYQIKTSKQLSDILEKYQSGNAVSSDINGSESNDVEPAISSRDAALNRDISGSFTRDNTSEALTSGYGASKYDNVYTAGQDVEQTRALNQSGIAKIASGAAKFGVTALGTFVNTSLGLASGVIEGAAAVITDGNKDGKRTVGEFFDAATTNEVADFTLKMQKWAEEVFPNYYTQEERSDEYQRQWYKHMLSPNSIGDDILKNFGFTVGSIAGAGSWMKLLSKKAVRNLSGDVMKGALMGAEGDAASTAELKRVSEALQRGNLTRVNIDQLGNNIKNVGRTINTKRALTQVSGATIAAFSEGTFEGVNARDEWLNEFTEKAQSDLKDAYAKAEQDIFNSNNSAWVNNAGSTILGPDGSFMTVPALTFEGRRELGDKKYGLTQDYNRLMKEAETEGDRIAAATFGLNCLILIPSNLFQFGRILAGGWKTNRKMARLTGDIARGYTVSGSNLGTALRKSGAVALSEASEEILQGTVSSGTKSVADARLSSFNDKAYDPEQVRSARFWFENFISGADDYLSDVKNWKEGALGAITGLIGIPGRRWNGGVVGAIQDARDERDAASSAASYLNNIINSADFRSRWDGFIRHNAYDDDMAKAVKNNDQYSYHTASDMQLISDIVAFSDAGKLDDLKDFADSFVNISDEDIQILVDDRNKRGDNISVEDLRNKINENAKNIKNHIDAYKNLYDYHMSRATGDVSPQLMNEIIATSMQIKDYENRFVSVINDALTAIEPKLSEYEGKAKADKAKDVKSNLTDIRDFIENSLGLLNPVSISPAIADKIDKQLEEAIGELNLDKETAQKLRDARKLNKDRNAFYNKLNTLQTPAGAEQFEQQAQTPEKVDNASAKAYAKEQTENLNTLADVRAAYNEKQGADRDEFFATLKKASSNNPAIKSFVDMKNFIDDFDAFVSRTIDTGDESLNSRIHNAIAKLLNNASSVDDIKALPDNVFDFKSSVEDKATQAFASAFGMKNSDIDNRQDEIKSILRNAMRDFLRLKSDTQANVKQKPVVAEGGTSTDGTGYDAPAPASTTGIPKASDTFEVGDVLTIENWDANGVRTDVFTVKVTKVFDNGGIEVEGGIEYSPKMVRAYFGKENPVLITKHAHSWITHNSRLGDAVPYNFREAAKPTEPVAEYPTEAEEQAIDIESQNNDKYYVFQEGVETKNVTDEDGKKKHPYYRSSVPEIDSFQAAEARQAILDNNPVKYREADLSDFVEKHSEYSEVWNALKDRGAFDYVSTELKEDDEIEFIIDPTFPKYNGQTQILVAKNVDGKHQVLSVFTYKNDDYIGVNDLRKKILDEYDKFVKTNPNDIYVFGEKSKVFAIRPGLIEYKYEKDSEKPIHDVPSYSESAPIVAVLRNRETGSFETTVIRGNASVKADADKVIAPSAKNKYGMYYLVKSNAGALKYVPVRLNVARFNSETAGLDQNKTISDIGNALHRIASIVADADKDNYKDKLVEMRKAVGSLGKLIDIHNDYFDLKYSDDRGAYLFLAQDAFKESLSKEDRKKPKSLDLKYEDETKISMWLFRQVQKMNRHIQIDDSTTQDKLQSLIDDNLVTTNAQRLRMKGVDFWFDSWDASEGKFLNPKDPWARKDISESKDQTVIVELKSSTEAAIMKLTSRISSTSGDLRKAAQNVDGFEEAFLNLTLAISNKSDNAVGYFNELMSIARANSDNEACKALLDAVNSSDNNLTGAVTSDDPITEEDLEKALADANKFDEPIYQPVEQSSETSDGTVLNVNNQDDVNNVLNSSGELDMQKLVNSTFDELPEDIRKDLLDNGYDDETWSGLSDKMKERLLACRNV